MTNILRTNQGSAFAYPGKDKLRTKFVRGREAFIESLGIVYSIDRDFTGANPKAIKVYDYLNYDGEPVEVHQINDADLDVLQRLWITSDNKYICSGSNPDQDLALLYILDSEFNVIEKATYDLFSTTLNALDIAVDEKNGCIYVQQAIGSNEGYVRKFDFELTQIWEVNYDVSNHTFDGIALTQSGKLFGYGSRLFQDFDGHIFEINTDTGARNSPIDTPVDADYQRPRAFTESPEGKLHLVCAGNAGSATLNGAILVYDNDLNLEEIIYADDFVGAIDFAGSTSGVYYECFVDGIAYQCDSENQKLRKINYLTKEVIWEVGIKEMNPSGTLWSTGRPNSMSVDTFGNVIIGIGIGSDSRSIGVVTSEGVPIFGESNGVETAFCSIHYDGWQLKLKKPKDTTPPPVPENINAVSSNDNVVVSWDPVDFNNVRYNVYKSGQKINGAPLSQNSFTDENVSIGNSYEYYVTSLDGSGNESDPSETVNIDHPSAPEGFTAVSTPEDLRNINDDLAGSYFLINDIDLSEHGNFLPIGIDDAGNVIATFSGVFNGGGHTISNLVSDQGVDGIVNDRGLFRQNTGTLKNLGLINPVVTKSQSTEYVGALTGINSGSILNCYTDGGTVNTGGDRGGGILGYQSSSGHHEHCYSNTNGDTGGTRAGVFSGYNESAATGLNSYYNSDLGGAGTFEEAIAKTTAQLKQKATFVDWDFEVKWEIDEVNDFPRLRKGII